jgi:phage gpG-like protein
MPDLTTLDAVKAFLVVTTSNQDALISRLISRESRLIEEWCGRSSFSPVTRTAQRINGSGSSMLPLPDVPILSVSALSDGGTSIPVSATAGSYGYTFDDSRLYLNGGVFSRGRQNITCTYTAGYQASETSTIPSDSPAQLTPTTGGRAISVVSVVNASTGAAHAGCGKSGHGPVLFRRRLLHVCRGRCRNVRHADVRLRPGAGRAGLHRNGGAGPEVARQPRHHFEEPRGRDGFVFLARPDGLRQGAVDALPQDAYRMSTFTVNMKAEALLARLAGSQDRLKQELRIVLQRLAIKVQGQVKSDKLTGQVLHVRSGTLRRSINQKLFETKDGVYAQVGTNVKYAGIHEYGFDGVEHVSAHTRRSALQFSVGRSKRVRKSEGTINVRAFDRHMVMPKRSFLVSTLVEDRSEIETSIRAAIIRGLQP